MAERSIARVRIALSGETVELPWASREALLDQLRALDAMRPVVDLFKAVGMSRPVALKHQPKVALLQTIEAPTRRTARSTGRHFSKPHRRTESLPPLTPRPRASSNSPRQHRRTTSSGCAPSSSRPSNGPPLWTGDVGTALYLDDCVTGEGKPPLP